MKSITALSSSNKNNGGWFTDIQQCYHTLRGSLGLIAACTLGVLSIAVAYVVFSPSIYASRSVIRVEQRKDKVINIQDVNQEDLEAMDVMKTIEQSLVTDELLMQVVKDNGLTSNPEFRARGLLGLGSDQAKTDDEMIATMTKRLKAKIRRGTRLIDITAESKDPMLAQQLVRSLIDDYMKQNFDQRGQASQSANGFLVQEAERLKAKLETSERELQDYREKSNAVSLEDKQNIIVDTLKTLNGKLTEARSTRMKLESDVAQYKALADRDPKQLLTISTIADSPAVLDAKRRVSDQEGEIAKLTQRYGPEHPRFIQAKSQLAQIESDYLKTILKAGDEAGASYEAAIENERKLEGALHEQEKLSLELNKIAIPYNVLVRNVQADRELYESVVTRVKETDITKALETAPIKVIEQARIATKPVRPKKLLLLALGLFAGFGLGVGLTLALNAMDTSVRTVDEAEQAFLVSVLSAVPQLEGRAAKQAVSMLHSPSSTTAEAFRSLRTVLELKDVTDRQILVFTSALPEEGKTFCSVNCAVACAQYGYRTLIVDADLRRPSVAKTLGCSAPQAPGLGDCLAGSVAVSQAIQETGIKNLSILPAGTLAANPAELISGGRMATLFMDPLFKAFDRIIFDTPPVNAVSDALHIVRLATAVCLVVHAGKTPTKASQRAYAALVSAKAPDIGIVLNRLQKDHSYAVAYGREGAYGAKIQNVQIGN